MPEQSVPPKELNDLDAALRAIIAVLVAQGNEPEAIVDVLWNHLGHRVTDIVKELVP